MGLTDAAEQLAACQEDAANYERTIAALQADLAVHRRQVAELEAENVRLESALGDRLRHDRHGVAQLEADLGEARARLAIIDGLTAEDQRDRPLADLRRDFEEIRDALDGIPPHGLLVGDDATVAAGALRLLAVLTSNAPAFPPSELEALADRIRPA